MSAVRETQCDSGKPNDDSASVLKPIDSSGEIPKTDSDQDIFICSKCNIVFKNLSEYLEHKIKDENYRISQTKSKIDKRISIPQLVQKRKYTKRKYHTKKSKLDDSTESLSAKSLEQDHCYDDAQVQAKKSKTNEVAPSGSSSTGAAESNAPNEADFACEVNQAKNTAPSTKEEISNEEDTSQLNQGGSQYKCSVCNKKFRRQATLRWHVQYEHKQKNENSDDSEHSADEVFRDESSKDKDFEAGNEQEEKDDHTLESDTTVTRESAPTEIHVVIEKPQRQPVLKQTGEKSQKGQSDDKDKDQRPYKCETCGRTFKELTVLKAHSVVHSDDRKYVCTVGSCPYGFKTKGGLVRHMRRHTGERPFPCEKCGRSFSESGALTRHLKAKRNCSAAPDTQFPRYMKGWNYHPNIPAVMDPEKRDTQRGRSTIPLPSTSPQKVHYVIKDSTKPIGADGTDASGLPVVEIKIEREENSPHLTFIAEMPSGPSKPSAEVSSSITDNIKSEMPVEEMVVVPVPNVERENGEVTEVTDLVDLKKNAELEFLNSTQCHVCKKDFESVDGLEIHLHSHLADQPSHCGLCHFLSNNREELRKHILSLHHDSLNNIEASVLSMEEDTSNTVDQSGRDKRAVLRDALIAVKQLYTLKNSKTSSTNNSSTMSTTGSLQCMVCNKMFKGSSYLKQHMRMHTGDRPYSCPHCDNSFTSRDILKKHMYVHSDKREFKCGECGKLFKRLPHVQQHLRVHFQERQFRCHICDKYLKSQNSLKVHMRTHSGINPYKCHVCNRQFRERGSLQRHLRLHSGEKPFACPHCKRCFAEQGTLTRHLKAKVPCSVTRNQASSGGSGTVLAQFSSMVADTQPYIIPQVDSGQQLILPIVKTVQGREEVFGEEYVVLQTGDAGSEVVENIEVITEGALPGTDIELSSDLIDKDQTETLQILDSTTGESVFIVADKSVVDLVKSQELTFESSQGESSIQRIKDLILAAGEGKLKASTVEGEGLTHGGEEFVLSQDTKGAELIEFQNIRLQGKHVTSQSGHEKIIESNHGHISQGDQERLVISQEDQGEGLVISQEDQEEGLVISQEGQEEELVITQEGHEEEGLVITHESQGEELVIAQVEDAQMEGLVLLQDSTEGVEVPQDTQEIELIISSGTELQVEEKGSD